jgi:hypothetical protein
MFKVSYSLKNKQGYVIDKNKNFSDLKEAFSYMSFLRKKSTTLGLPIVETIVEKNVGDVG